MKTGPEGLAYAYLRGEDEALDAIVYTGVSYIDGRIRYEARRERLGATWARSNLIDVRQEAFACLLERRQANSLLAGSRPLADAVKVAVRRVASDTVQPGRRTRHSQTAESHRVDPALADQIGKVSSESAADIAASPGSLGFSAVEDHVALRQILPDLIGAAYEVRAGLIAVYVDEVTITQAANDLGLTRFTLKRMMDAFCAPYREAA